MIICFKFYNCEATVCHWTTLLSLSDSELKDLKDKSKLGDKLKLPCVDEEFDFVTSDAKNPGTITNPIDLVTPVKGQVGTISNPIDLVTPVKVRI